MKIPSAVQIRELDAYTIANEPIASIDLMERAATALTQWFTERFHAGNRIGIVCGTGNNGGDGLASARLLKDWGFPLKVWIVGGKPGSEDFEINRKRLPGAIQTTEITDPLPANMFADCDVVVDAIFGTGLSRPVEGIYAAAIEAINQAKAIRVSIDLPSGLLADKPSGGPIVAAHYTVSFQLPKLAFFQPANHQYVGEWVLVDIGLSKEGIRSMETPHVYLLKRNIKKLMRQVSVFAHKGSNGKALLVAGSQGKMGACVLASRAAIRSGLGLLTVHVPACGYTIVQTSVPEAMASIDGDDRVFAQPPSLDAYHAIGLGPGIGTVDQTVAAVEQVLKNYKRPLVIDADGLNILASHRNLLKEVPPGSILTPHPGEFERLVGRWSNDFEKLDKLRSLSQQLNSYIILKGAYTVTCTPDGRLFFNSTGNPGMAKGGCGDALAGVLTGLLAQGYDSLAACKIGVFVHGLAGDLALREGSVEGLIPSDLIACLPRAFREVRQ